MKLEIAPPEPFKLGARFSDYPELEQNTHTIDGKLIKSADGRVLLDGVDRYVPLGETDGNIDSIALNSLAPGDTFMGVPLSLRPVKFRNELKKLGISTTGDPWDFKLVSSNILFWVEEGEIASINWKSSNPLTSYKGTRHGLSPDTQRRYNTGRHSRGKHRITR